MGFDDEIDQLLVTIEGPLRGREGMMRRFSCPRRPFTIARQLQPVAEH